MFDPDNSDRVCIEIDPNYQEIHNELELTPYWFADRVL